MVYISKTDQSVEKILEHLKKYLSQERYKHSLNVADTAKELALQIGYNDHQAYLAGLLHDVGKHFSLEDAHKLGLKVSPNLVAIYKSYHKIWHALIAPLIIQKVFKINNRALLNAVKWHTTGKKNMSVLDKIIFLADYLEPDRDLANIPYLKTLLDNDLNNAVFAVSLSTIISLLKRNLKIHKYSFDCFNFYLEKIGNKNAEKITGRIFENYL